MPNGAVHIKVEGLGLTYPLIQQQTLARRPSPKERRQISLVGGQVELRGRRPAQVTALRDVSFSLEAGDRLALIGSNGAGKTTLLKVLYGIFEPTAGRIDVHGRVDALFNINLGFRPEATGRRNIELRGLINGWSRFEIEERMDGIIAFSEMGEFIDMPLKYYSQGMGARLAFATATSFEPEILLMDEWIGAGDPPFQEKARERIGGVVASAGIIILASHNLSLLEKTCTRGLILERGHSVYLRPLGEAIDFYTPRTSRAA
jgi:ABC-type polysaccharide/polyol phosphate transport system ATPase subunit